MTFFRLYNISSYRIQDLFSASIDHHKDNVLDQLLLTICINKFCRIGKLKGKQQQFKIMSYNKFNNSNSSMRKFTPKFDTNPEIVLYLKDIALNHIIQSRWEDIYRFNERFIECSNNASQMFSDFMEENFAQYRMRLYGSSIFGMYFEGSDINIALEPTENTRDDVISRVEESIALCPFLVYTKKLNKYTLEIVIDPQYQLKKQQQNYLTFHVVIRIMLNPYFNINFNIKSTTMVANFLQDKLVLRVVLVMLKKIMMNANLMNKFQGGINSYCLFLMLASYMTQNQINFKYTSSGSLFAGMVNFYAEHFDPSETVIYFNRSHPCYMRFQDFRKVNYFSQMVVNEKGEKTYIDFKRPLYIYDPMQKKLLDYGFEKGEQIIQVFKQIKCFLNELEYGLTVSSSNFFYRNPFYANSIIDVSSLCKYLIENEAKKYGDYSYKFSQLGYGMNNMTKKQ